MQMRKLYAALLASALVAGVFVQSGCDGSAAKNRKPKDDKITIGLSMATLKEERWYMDRDDFIAEAQKLNADVVVQVAFDNADEQLKQVRSLIYDHNVDVLVLIPHDAQSAAAAVEMAKKAGVKVISYDRLVRNANVDLYISFDNVKVGRLQAEAMVKAVPNGNYVIVDGPATDYNSVMIDEGIKEVLSPYIESGKINILSEYSSNDWMADEAAEGMNKLLQDGAKIDAVIAENDSLAGGVINTLSEYHLVPNVPVTGMDADLAGCQRVVEGQQLMTVYKPIKLLAAAAADFAVKMAKGEEIGVLGRMSDGKYNVPYFSIMPEAVTKDNMVDAVINDGFHNMSEVYLNVPKEQWPQQ